MSVKIVTFDPGRPKFYYKDLIKAIERYKSVRITEWLWFINTGETCEDVFRNLEIFVDINDRLLIQDLNEKEISGMNLLATQEEMESVFK